MRGMNNKRRKGSSIVETAAGLILLVPIVLFLVDVAAMVVAQTENDKLAKACARAAAELPTGKGTLAAQGVYNTQTKSNLLTPKPFGFGSPPSGTPVYAGDGNVTVTTTISCTLPVPVPFIGTGSVDFVARATEPIVGELPP